ncbi:sigma factor [Streptomyces sp. NPDC020800]|uniref:sigma factor n=1 Tax=Streptomyces sp. NPDC020800 TaxID=3365092 RepID=UPI0037B6A20A
MNNFAAPAAPLRPQILALCYRMLGSAGDAEDATQETCPGAQPRWAAVTSPTASTGPASDERSMTRTASGAPSLMPW